VDFQLDNIVRQSGAVRQLGLFLRGARVAGGARWDPTTGRFELDVQRPHHEGAREERGLLGRRRWRCGRVPMRIEVEPVVGVSNTYPDGWKGAEPEILQAMSVADGRTLRLRTDVGTLFLKVAPRARLRAADTGPPAAGGADSCVIDAPLEPPRSEAGDA